MTAALALAERYERLYVPALLQHVGYDFANGLFVLYDEDKPIIRVHHRESYGKPLSILRRDPPTIVAGSASVAYCLSDEW